MTEEKVPWFLVEIFTAVSQGYSNLPDWARRVTNDTPGIRQDVELSRERSRRCLEQMVDDGILEISDALLEEE
jgi:hypothetical protein